MTSLLNIYRESESPSATVSGLSQCPLCHFTMTPHNPQICKLFTTNPQICKIFKTNPLDSRAAAHISVECASWVSSSLTVHDSTSKASRMRMLRMLRMLNDWIRMHERDGFLEICTSALRVQVFFVCNIIVRIIIPTCKSARALSEAQLPFYDLL